MHEFPSLLGFRFFVFRFSFPFFPFFLFPLFCFVFAQSFSPSDIMLSLIIATLLFASSAVAGTVCVSGTTSSGATSFNQGNIGTLSAGSSKCFFLSSTPSPGAQYSFNLDADTGGDTYRVEYGVVPAGNSGTSCTGFVDYSGDFNCNDAPCGLPPGVYYNVGTGMWPAVRLTCTNTFFSCSFESSSSITLTSCSGNAGNCGTETCQQCGACTNGAGPNCWYALGGCTFDISRSSCRATVPGRPCTKSSSCDCAATSSSATSSSATSSSATSSSGSGTASPSTCTSGDCCRCNCCNTGGSCSPAFVGSFSVASCNSCSLAGCRSNFAFTCPNTNGVVTSSCSSVSSPSSPATNSPSANIWAGTYIINAGCATSQCCCLSGTATVVQSGTSVTINSGLTGQCNGQTTASIPITLSSATSTSASFTFGGQSFTATKNGDTVQVTNNDNNACSASATCTSGSCKTTTTTTSSSNVCFHKDTVISYAGKDYSFDEIRAHPECSIPHVVQSTGVVVAARCGNETKTLKLTPGHLLYTQRGLQAAGDLKPGHDIVFGDTLEHTKCTVLSVTQDNHIDSYFGLNCLNSEVLADGLKASTFEKLHSIPSFWMAVVGRIVGIKQASSVGDYISELVQKMNLV